MFILLYSTQSSSLNLSRAKSANFPCYTISTHLHVYTWVRVYSILYMCSSTEHVTSAINQCQSPINRLPHTLTSCIRHYRLGHTLHHALSIGTIANRCSFVFHHVCILCTVNILSVEHFISSTHAYTIHTCACTRMHTLYIYEYTRAKTNLVEFKHSFIRTNERTSLRMQFM